ncbi:hypothetical protein Scep_016684 [Stephania cephalantha]|uniref:Uncharacterized protein n=1 Tax=Stephania cephalantha TaxID=152367 RepID=A0AAP0IPX2_9MAGN
MCEIPIGLSHIMIAYMNPTLGFGCHLPYAHIITTFFEAAQIDLHQGGCPLIVSETIGMATLKAMKYFYIRIEQQWICKEDIPDGEHYEGYESPLRPILQWTSTSTATWITTFYTCMAMATMIRLSRNPQPTKLHQLRSSRISSLYPTYHTWASLIQRICLSHLPTSLFS